MSEIWTLGIVALFFLAAGFFLGSYIVKLKTQSGQSALREREQQLSHNLELLGADLQEARGQNQALQLEKNGSGRNWSAGNRRSPTWRKNTGSNGNNSRNSKRRLHGNSRTWPTRSWTKRASNSRNKIRKTSRISCFPCRSASSILRKKWRKPGRKITGSTRRFGSNC